MPPAPANLHQALDAAFDAKESADKASVAAAASDEAVKQAQDTAKAAHGAAGDAAQKVTTLEGQFVNDFKSAIEGPAANAAPAKAS